MMTLALMLSILLNILLVSLYLTGARNAVHVETYLLMLLLSKDLAATQHDEFVSFLRASSGDTPLRLRAIAGYAVRRFASELCAESPTALGVVQKLWQTKQQGAGANTT